LVLMTPLAQQGPGMPTGTCGVSTSNSIAISW
jgi:hypothetical protein